MANYADKFYDIVYNNLSNTVVTEILYRLTI